MRVAVYARVSTQRQAQARTTDQQLDRLRAHAEGQGWSLAPDRVFRDDGYSGASLRRPGLDRLRDGTVKLAGDGLRAGGGAGYRAGMTPAARSPYAGHRFPPEVISHAVWLYFRFPLALRMVEELLAARGIAVSHETVRQWALKFGQGFANEIRRRLPRPGDKWHLDEVQIKIAGEKHWLWRAVDQDGLVLDVLVQSRRDKRAAKGLGQKPRAAGAAWCSGGFRSEHRRDSLGSCPRHPCPT